MNVSRGFDSLARPRVRGARLALLLCCVLLAIAAHAPVSRAAVNPITWSTSRGVTSILQAGNVVYVGGNFTTVGPATGSGVPLSTGTFTPVPGFPRVVGTVSAVAADGSGGWYIGGLFTHVGGVARQNLAHIAADLSVDGWNPGTDGEVLAIQVLVSDVVVGGLFMTVNGQARQRLARVSRATAQPSSWTPSPNERVTGLASDGTTLYVCGRFDGIAGSPRNGLAAFTLATDALTNWDPAATGPSPISMASIALANGYLYVAGGFTAIGGQPRANVAALRTDTGAATAWNPAGPSDSGVTQVLPVGDRAVLGGSFWFFAGQNRYGLVAVDTLTGALLPWNPNLGPHVDPPFLTLPEINALANVNGKVAVGGWFSSLQGAHRNGFAVVDTSAGAALVATPVPALEPGTHIRALAHQGSQLYVGGQFAILDGTGRTKLAAIDVVTGEPTSWAPFPWYSGASSQFPGFPPFVTALAMDSTRVFAVLVFYDQYLSGVRSAVQAFSRANGVMLWQRDSDQLVHALAASGGRVYAGGNFSYPAQRLAALDAATGAPQPWTPAPNGTVRSLLVTPGGLVVGGEFSNLGGQPRARIGQVDFATGAATSWNPGADNTVWALAHTGSTLFAGGDFQNAGGQPRSRVAAFDLGSNGALPWDPGAAGTVYALATDGANLYAGGAFTAFAGQPALRFAAVSASTGLPLGWSANANSTVQALAIANQQVYAGGGFGAIDAEPVRGLASLFDPALLDVETRPLVPRALSLAVGPSPLRAAGRVRFTLGADARVWLRAFDVSGRVARTLVAGEQFTAGPHTIPLERTGLAPGVYLLQLTAGTTQATTRFVVVP